MWAVELGGDLRLMIDGHGLQMSFVVGSADEMVATSEKARAADGPKGLGVGPRPKPIRGLAGSLNGEGLGSRDHRRVLPTTARARQSLALMLLARCARAPDEGRMRGENEDLAVFVLYRQLLERIDNTDVLFAQRFARQGSL